MLGKECPQGVKLSFPCRESQGHIPSNTYTSLLVCFPGCAKSQTQPNDSVNFCFSNKLTMSWRWGGREGEHVSKTFRSTEPRVRGKKASGS